MAPSEAYWIAGYAAPGYVDGDNPPVSAATNIANYDALKAAIAAWLNRADISDRIDDFIDLAEARFNRELRVNAMVARSRTTVTDDYVELPPDWLQLISVQVDGASDAAVYVGTKEFYDTVADGYTGAPRFYTIVGNALRFLPAPVAPTRVEITYYKSVPALSETMPTNWLLARSPDLYLFAALVVAEPYLMNDERVTLWAAQSTAIIGSMNRESERAARPSGELRRKMKSF